MSFTVSFHRRMLPATSIRSTGDVSLICPTISSASGRTLPRGRRSTPAPDELDPLEDVLFGLFLDARQAGEFSRPREGFELIDALDLHLLVEHLHRLRTEAGHPQELEHPRGNLRLQRPRAWRPSRFREIRGSLPPGPFRSPVSPPAPPRRASATSFESPSMFWAARWYALTRKTFSPLSSSSSAISSKIFAICWFSMNASPIN